MTTMTKQPTDHFSRMEARLAEGLAEVNSELAAAQDEALNLGLEVEAGDATPDTIKRLASAEKTCEKLQAERARLLTTTSGLHERIAEARRQAEYEKRVAAGREYVRAMETMQESENRIAALLTGDVAAEAAKARAAGREAHLAARVAFGGNQFDNSDGHGKALGKMADSILGGPFDNRSRASQDETRALVARPWRQPRGPIAEALDELGC